MALFDFPSLQIRSVRECAVRLALDPTVADIRHKIVRLYPLFPGDLRVVWSCPPNAQDRALVDQVWRTFRPKGKVEHSP
jgi:hypothetical protein